MAITLTATGTDATTTAATSLTLEAFDATGGTVLVAFVGLRSSASQTVTQVLYGTQGLTQHALTAGTYGRLYTFSLVNPASGTHDLVVTASAADNMALIVRALSGTHATTPCRATNETIDVTNTADSLSVVSTTAQVGDLCLDCCQLIDTTTETMTENGGQANVATAVPNVSQKLSGSTEAGAVNVSMGWSGWTNTRCRIVIVPIAPAVGGGAGGDASGILLRGVG